MLLEFRKFLCEDVTSQCCILVLVLERRLVGCSLALVSECSDGVGGSRFEVVLSLLLGCGEGFGSRVATFDGVERVVATCEIGVGVFANFTR